MNVNLGDMVMLIVGLVGFLDDIVKDFEILNLNVKVNVI